jgi:hypothetical protein
MPQEGMVDALREARRVLTLSGILIDERPVTAPMVFEVIAAGRAIWAVEVNSHSPTDDHEAADAAVRHALSSEWFAFEKSHPFDFDVYCDTAEDLRLYAQEHRRMRETDIPYQDLELRRQELCAVGQAARLRCRRPWMLTSYRKK